MCFSRFAAIYSEHQPLIKHEGHVRKKKKTTWSYSILLCMKTVLQWFRGQSGTWWPRNQTLKNVRGGRAPSSWLVPGSIPWTPKNARERSQERQFSFSALALLTTPQKHLRIASYKLWSHSGSNQARTSRKTAKITFFHVFSLAQAFFFLTKSSNIEVLHQHMPTSC